ncbi:MAG TPA: hypothetical protein VIO14_08510 [Dehalococcoidia bacterium]
MVQVRVDEAARQEYRQAYDRWMEDLARVHAVFLEGERMDPLHLKALLTRESKSKERYDAARRRLLGLPDPEEAS